MSMWILGVSFVAAASPGAGPSMSWHTYTVACARSVVLVLMPVCVGGERFSCRASV